MLQDLASFFDKYSPHRGRYRCRKYLTVLVILPNGMKKWYRLSPKIAKATNQYEKFHHELPKSTLIGSYINVPLIPYFGNCKSVISVGKIIRLKYAYVPSRELCTRSQFIEANRITNIHDCYNYLKHDYGHYSRLNIHMSLYYWHKQEKQKSNPI